MVQKTCKFCGKKRLVGDFYYEGALDKELCGWCLYRYYKEKGILEGWIQTKAAKKYEEVEENE